MPDVNVYQQKKTLAQGMMDLALLSANANQLRYVLESYNNHPYFYASLTFITISIILQVMYTHLLVIVPETANLIECFSISDCRWCWPDLE